MKYINLKLREAKGNKNINLRLIKQKNIRTMYEVKLKNFQFDSSLFRAV